MRQIGRGRLVRVPGFQALAALRTVAAGGGIASGEDLGRDNVLDQPAVMFDLAELGPAVRAAAFAPLVQRQADLLAGIDPAGHRPQGGLVADGPAGRAAGLLRRRGLTDRRGRFVRRSRRFRQFQQTLVQSGVLLPQSVIVPPQGPNLGSPLGELPVQGNVVHLQVVELLWLRLRQFLAMSRPQLLILLLQDALCVASSESSPYKVALSCRRPSICRSYCLARSATIPITPESLGHCGRRSNTLRRTSVTPVL